MSMNNYLLQKEGETYFLLKQTVELVVLGHENDGEWHSDWEKIFSSLDYDEVRRVYENISFAGGLVDLETFGEGTYGEGAYV